MVMIMNFLIRILMFPFNITKSIFRLTLPIVCLLTSGLFLTSLTDVSLLEKLYRDLIAMPNYNYIPDIKELDSQGRKSEALELARYILQTPELPGQEEAKELANKLESELDSIWGKTKRVMSGFVFGEGNSIEEIGGSITADMIVYGDIRDLIKQGYYKVTGNDTDAVVAALAGVGLITEVVDLSDWAPSVFKAFRKVGALSDKFAKWLIIVCERSIKTKKLDDGLKMAFDYVRILSDTVGIGRAATMFKYVDNPSDLEAITKFAIQTPDTAYIMMKVGNKEALKAIKTFDNSPQAIMVMTIATQKGTKGIEWLNKGGSVGTLYLFRTRVAARVLKNLHLGRIQAFITEAAKNKFINLFFWGMTIITGTIGIGGVFVFLRDRHKKDINNN